MNEFEIYQEFNKWMDVIRKRVIVLKTGTFLEKEPGINFLLINNADEYKKYLEKKGFTDINFGQADNYETGRKALDLLCQECDIDDNDIDMNKPIFVFAYREKPKAIKQN